MEFLNKLFTILILFIIIFFWNKYVVEFIINRLEKFHKNNNFRNLNKQPIRFLLQNKNIIIEFAKAFYWIGFTIITIMILIDFFRYK